MDFFFKLVFLLLKALNIFSYYFSSSFIETQLKYNTVLVLGIQHVDLVYVCYCEMITTITDLDFMPLVLSLLR